MSGLKWRVTTKADQRPRLLADRHYTRKRVGHPMWTRPGWNQILYFEQKSGRAAAFCWWRPKWESGLPGTERKDKLRCIECTLFRNETRYRSSDLITEAWWALVGWEHYLDTSIPDGLITGINSAATRDGRSGDSPAGHCYRMAGWEPFEHPGKGKRADTWLRIEPPPRPSDDAAAAARVVSDIVAIRRAYASLHPSIREAA